MPCIVAIKWLDANTPSIDPKLVWKAGFVIDAFPADYPFTDAESPASGNFMHYTVSDKEPEEVSDYFQRWNKVVSFTVVNGPDPSGFRRIRITNEMVSVSGQNAWEQANVDAFIDQWNTRYPDADLVEIGFDDVDVVVEGTFTTGQAEEFDEVVTKYGLSSTHAQRRWYITPSGMQSLEDNGGAFTGTAQQLGTILRDGLLD